MPKKCKKRRITRHFLVEGTSITKHYFFILYCVIFDTNISFLTNDFSMVISLLHIIRDYFNIDDFSCRTKKYLSKGTIINDDDNHHRLTVVMKKQNSRNNRLLLVHLNLSRRLFD